MSQYTPLPQQPASTEIDLFALAHGLWQQKVVIGLTAALVTLLASIYAWFATPHYEVQSVLRPAAIKDLDELNATGLYSLKPEQALRRVGAALDSYDVRLNYFNRHQQQFNVLLRNGRTPEQAFEAFNEKAFRMLQPDAKAQGNLAPFVGIRLTYPRGVDGPEVTNGLVLHAINVVREQVVADLNVIIENRLSVLDRKIIVARAAYEAEKSARIARLEEADSLKRAELQDELLALRQELRAKRDNRIEQLSEAIQIAKSLGIVKPTTPSTLGSQTRSASGNIIRTEVNNQRVPLYFMGTEALDAERQALLARSSDDFTNPRIAQIAKELQLLEHNRQVEMLNSRENEDLFLAELADMRSEAARLRSIALEPEHLNLVRIDQAAQPPLQPVKPKKVLVIVLGAVLGLVLGIAIVLVRIALRSRPRADIAASV